MPNQPTINDCTLLQEGKVERPNANGLMLFKAIALRFYGQALAGAITHTCNNCEAVRFCCPALNEAHGSIQSRLPITET